MYRNQANQGGVAADRMAKRQPTTTSETKIVGPRWVNTLEGARRSIFEHKLGGSTSPEWCVYLKRNDGSTPTGIYTV
ncbi:MAG: hypothetical protein ABIN94_13330 [Ferruginibacter sp.]